MAAFAVTLPSWQPLTPMVCGCIDIGSNTTRVLVADAIDGRLVEVLQRRAFTRIGKGLKPGAEIPRAKIEEVAGVVAAHRALAERGRRAPGPHRRDRRDPRRRQPRGVRRGRRRARRGRRRRSSRARRRRGWRSSAPRGRSGTSSRAPSRWSTSAAARPRSRSARSRAASPGGASVRLGSGHARRRATWLGDPPDDRRAAGDARARRRRARGAGRPAAATRPWRSAAAPPRCAGSSGRCSSRRRSTARSDVLAGGPGREVADAAARSTRERVRLLPAGSLILDAAAQRLGCPLQIGGGGLREGVLLEARRVA